MSKEPIHARYHAVAWDRQKKVYDVILAGGLIVYLALFVGLGAVIHPGATAETLLIRGFGTAALLLLHLVLSIGPLTRLDSRFYPLLYNRRHLGVTMFFMASVHGVFAIIQYHAFGDINPLVSVLLSNARLDSLSQFPFQPIGLAELLIFFLMAATSHDFWMANLTPPVWKALHMLVYVAYALVVVHVSLGVLQSETHPVLAGVMAAGGLWVSGLHVWAGQKEKGLDGSRMPVGADGYVFVGAVSDIPEGRAVIAVVGGERVAIFKYDRKISAVSNVCQHQNGPLGEGRVIAGLITCPWHGFQYCPVDGKSPAPFRERVPTFDVKLVNGRVFVREQPNLPGTAVAPAQIPYRD
ncbi:MAG: ferric reductase-like transmembrane domain-containing protein [bacterium]|nr:ferric reductase-like transmembrane domain-containing protein [bacterium]